MSFLTSVTDSLIASHVGHPKIVVRVNGRLQGEDPQERGAAAVRAWVAVCATWWQQHRGVNIAFVQEPAVRSGRMTSHPCYLLFVILEQPEQPPQVEGQTQQCPPVFAPPRPASAVAPLMVAQETSG